MRSGAATTVWGVMRHAKIVCTLGPATDTPERARALVEAGIDVARLNFSHGAHADHEFVLLWSMPSRSALIAGLLAEI